MLLLIYKTLNGIINHPLNLTGITHRRGCWDTTYLLLILRDVSYLVISSIEFRLKGEHSFLRLLLKPLKIKFSVRHSLLNLVYVLGNFLTQLINPFLDSRLHYFLKILVVQEFMHFGYFSIDKLVEVVT